MKVLQLVDSEVYVKANCYQHQLYKSLCDLYDITLCDITSMNHHDVSEYDAVISTLKMRTLDRLVNNVKNLMKHRKLVVYDQDPWESYRINGGCVGAYEKVAEKLSASFVVTTPWWTPYIQSKGHDVSFINMGVLPEYCNSSPKVSSRDIDVGFIGTLHPHRQEFLAAIQQHHDVNIMNTSSKPYNEFLDVLSTLKIYARSDNMEMKLIDGTITNMNFGMFAKDIEVAARGGFSIRDRATGDAAAIGTPITCAQIKTIITYESLEEASQIIATILKTDPDELDHISAEAVELIRNRDYWSVAARHLVDECLR